MVFAQKLLIVFTLAAAATWLIAGRVASHYRGLFFPEDSDMTTAADAAALSNAALIITGCCVAGLCVISAVQDLVTPANKLLSELLKAEDTPQRRDLSAGF